MNNSSTFSDLLNSPPTATAASDYDDDDDDTFLLQNTSNNNNKRGLDAVAGVRIPKFKSLHPPSLLPINPQTGSSPSSYFVFPPGLSPSDLLDSPVLLSSSTSYVRYWHLLCFVFPSPCWFFLSYFLILLKQLLQSPTTGSFPSAAAGNLQNVSNKNNESYSHDFTFQPQSTIDVSRQSLQSISVIYNLLCFYSEPVLFNFNIRNSNGVVLTSCHLITKLSAS